MEKRCFKCGIYKDLDKFYKHKAMKDGHLNKCKECTNKDTKQNRKDKIDYYREYDRSRGNRQESTYIKEYRSKYPNKYKAHNQLNNSLRDGKIIKPSFCEICGNTENIVGHHSDYLKPLDVNWWCQACHVQWHKDNGEGLNP